MKRKIASNEYNIDENNINNKVIATVTKKEVNQNTTNILQMLMRNSKYMGNDNDNNVTSAKITTQYCYYCNSDASDDSNCCCTICKSIVCTNCSVNRYYPDQQDSNKVCLNCCCP